MNLLSVFLLCSIPACPGETSRACPPQPSSLAGDLAFARGCEPLPVTFDETADEALFRRRDPAPDPKRLSGPERAPERTGDPCRPRCGDSGADRSDEPRAKRSGDDPVDGGGPLWLRNREPIGATLEQDATPRARWERCGHKIPLDREGNCPVCKKGGGPHVA